MLSPALNPLNFFVNNCCPFNPIKCSVAFPETSPSDNMSTSSEAGFGEISNTSAGNKDVVLVDAWQSEKYFFI
jgi:hypothetical protein